MNDERPNPLDGPPVVELTNARRQPTPIELERGVSTNEKVYRWWQRFDVEKGMAARPAAVAVLAVAAIALILLAVGAFSGWFGPAAAPLADPSQPIVVGPSQLPTPLLPTSSPATAPATSAQTTPPTEAPMFRGTTPPPANTPTPAAVATPKPTVRPTVEPTPKATADASAVLFADWMTEAATAFRNLAVKIETAVAAGDFDTAAAVAADLRNRAADERAWLKAHPPTTCYAEAHDSGQAAVSAVEADADAVSGAAKTSDGKQVGELLEDVRQQAAALNSAASQADSC